MILNAPEVQQLPEDLRLLDAFVPILPFCVLFLFQLSYNRTGQYCKILVNISFYYLFKLKILRIASHTFVDCPHLRVFCVLLLPFVYVPIQVLLEFYVIDLVPRLGVVSMG